MAPPSKKLRFIDLAVLFGSMFFWLFVTRWMISAGWFGELNAMLAATIAGGLAGLLAAATFALYRRTKK